MTSFDLINSNFRRLFYGSLVSSFGSSLFMIGIIVWLQQTTKSTAIVTLLFALWRIISIVLGPATGVVSDRVNRKTIVIASDLISGFCMIALATCLVGGAQWPSEIIIPIVIVSSLLIYISSEFFAPASSALVTQVVPKERLREAFSLRSMLFETISIIGKGVGGTVVLFLGLPIMALANGFSFLISAFFESKIEIENSQRAVESRTKRSYRGYIQDLKEGFLFIYKNKGMFWFFVGVALNNFFMAPLLTLLPAYVSTELNISLDWYGYLMMIYGAGSFIGGWIARKATPSNRYFKMALVLGLLGPGLMWTVFGLTTSLPVIIAASFVAGLAFVYVGNLILAHLGAVTPNEMRGRVYANLSQATIILTPISILGLGWLVDNGLVDLSSVFLINGSLIVGNWTVLFITSKQARNFLSSPS